MNPYVDENDMPVVHEDAYLYVFNTKERDAYFAAVNKRPIYPEELTQFVVKSFPYYLTPDQIDVEIARILGVRLDAIDMPKETKDYIKRDEKVKAMATHWEKWRTETKFSIRAYAKQVLSYDIDNGGIKIHGEDATRIKNQDPSLEDELINTAYDQMTRWKLSREKNAL